MDALGYKSPRSAALVINQLIERGILRRRTKGDLQLIDTKTAEAEGVQTVDVPLVGTIPCGSPVVAEENIEAIFKVTVNLARPPHRYFLLRATGNSMNKKGIKDGNLVLVRPQAMAQNGDVVVALVDGEVTVKEYLRSEGVILLVPHSTNREHRPIVLTEDSKIQGVVVCVIPDLKKLTAM